MKNQPIVPCFAYGWAVKSNAEGTSALFNDGLTAHLAASDDGELSFGTPLCAELLRQRRDQSYEGLVYEAYPLPQCGNGADRPRALLVDVPTNGSNPTWLWAAAWGLDECGYSPLLAVHPRLLQQVQEPAAAVLDAVRSTMMRLRGWDVCYIHDQEALGRIVSTCALVVGSDPAVGGFFPGHRVLVPLFREEDGRLEIPELGISAVLPPLQLFTAEASA